MHRVVGADQELGAGAHENRSHDRLAGPCLSLSKRRQEPNDSTSPVDLAEAQKIMTSARVGGEKIISRCSREKDSGTCNAGDIEDSVDLPVNSCCFNDQREALKLAPSDRAWLRQEFRQSQIIQIVVANELPHSRPQRRLQLDEIQLVVGLLYSKRRADVEIEQHAQHHLVGDRMRDDQDVA